MSSVLKKADKLNLDLLASAQLTNKAFTGAGKGRIRQSLTALVVQVTGMGISLESYIIISYDYIPKVVYWFHLACPSIHLSVCLLTESCVLCILHNTCWISFIFIGLIKQLQKACPVLSFCNI